ncbi:mucin-2 [Kitasatospora sp. NBC_00070]|uniref:mucin-2 n=1 Tax=Kitasatospora sp. NBC_00070 TaxID=2975962 RepID=UPI003255784F
MTWFKVDDTAGTHPKLLKAGNAALGLWLRCGAYSAQHLTEGRIPGVVAALFGTAPQAARLVRAGLWHESGHECPRCRPVVVGEFLMHDFLRYNPTRASVEGGRDREAERKRKGRAAQRKPADPASNRPPFGAESELGESDFDPETPPDSDETAGEGHASGADGVGSSHRSRPGPARPVVGGGGSRESSGGVGRSPEHSLCALPDQWAPDDALLAWAAVAGHLQRLGVDGLDHATAKWRTHRATGPARSVQQWRLDWQQWITRERPDQPPAARRLQAVPADGHQPTRAEQHAAALQAALDQMNANDSQQENTA